MDSHLSLRPGLAWTCVSEHVLVSICLPTRARVKVCAPTEEKLRPVINSECNKDKDSFKEQAAFLVLGASTPPVETTVAERRQICLLRTEDESEQKAMKIFLPTLHY